MSIALAPDATESNNIIKHGELAGYLNLDAYNANPYFGKANQKREGGLWLTGYTQGIRLRLNEEIAARKESRK